MSKGVSQARGERNKWWKNNFVYDGLEDFIDQENIDKRGWALLNDVTEGQK